MKEKIPEKEAFKSCASRPRLISGFSETTDEWQETQNIERV